MEYTIGENIKVWKKYNSVEESMMFDLQDSSCCSSERMTYRLMGVNPTRIWIKDSWYDTIPLHELCRKKSDDGYYHFIYIQINMNTLEYYVGKVNRKRWSELKRYQGSGVKFKSKYAKNSRDFMRYYIAVCQSSAETERLEATIVDEALLKDPFCLNLVCGGGGTNTHNNKEEKRQRQKEYMKEHPEQFSAMLQAAKTLYCCGETPFLAERSRRIKETMNAPEYQEMTKSRIKKWREEDPEAYEESRKKLRAARQTKESREKSKASRERWIREHPEEHKKHREHMIEATQSASAKKKRKRSLKEWNESHPEEAQANLEKRSAASAQKCRKAVNMLDLQTGQIICTFESQHAAAEWLFSQGIAKSKNCVSSISAVCLKKPCSTGYGYRKKAYGFGWEFKET